VFGDTGGQRTMALVGDSHALEWFPAFDRAARASGTKLYFFAKLQCPFTDARVSGPKGPNPSCDAWRSAVTERLAKVPELDTVVMARSFKYRDELLDGRGKELAPSRVVSAWAAGTRRTLDDLTALAPKVILLKGTPDAPEDVPTCLSRSDQAADCAFDRDTGVAADAPLLAGERKAMQGRSGVEHLDLNGIACPDDPCPVVVDDGVVVYGDSNHLTMSFSRLVWRLVAERLKDA
jgi:hypothetical protein